MDSLKTRCFPSENYKSFHVGGKTLRIKIDPSRPIGELKYPEFYDVAINNLCYGRCEYCYANSTEKGRNFAHPTEKIARFFGTGMTDNQRPFQVAIGGHGEPTLHSEFIDVLREFHAWGITPNFTTNGMFVANGGRDIFDATKKYCGGVAVSCHKHLGPFWREAVAGFVEDGIKTNVHVIISDRQSIKEFEDIYKSLSNDVEYFVLLPYSSTGRAKPKRVEWKTLKAAMVGMDQGKIAFGANFYPYLLSDGEGIDVSLYEPEIMSKFLSLDGDGALYKSSFAKVPIATGMLV